MKTFDYDIKTNKNQKGANKMDQKVTVYMKKSQKEELDSLMEMLDKAETIREVLKIKRQIKELVNPILKEQNLSEI